MSFLDLLKIEFMKVKHSKIVPLIFIAPLLVVVSGGMIPAVLLFHYFFSRLSALYANGP